MIDHAVLAKTRAIYGNRFTASDFSNLEGSASVEDAAAYLKLHPAYSKAFEYVDMRGIHRSRLESVLKRAYYYDFVRIIKGMSKKDRLLADMVVRKYETDLILWALRTISLPAMEKAQYTELYGNLMQKYSRLPQQKLVSATSHREIIDILDGDARTILENASGSEGVDYLHAENELVKAYYARLFDVLEKQFKKDDITALFKMRTDLTNIIHIYRLRLVFNMSESRITPFLITPLYKLSENEVSAMCNAQSKGAFYDLLGQTRYKNVFKNASNIESEADIFIAEKAKRLIHFSNSTVSAVFGYLLFKEYEIGKIKTVIESVRYNRSSN